MPSFDVVSNTDEQEVDNVVNGVTREIQNRYDFKGSNCSLELEADNITVLADDDYKLQAMQDLLKVYATRRKIDPNAFEFKTPEKASGNAIRQQVVVKQGIDQETAKKIVKSIKDKKLKVQAAIQGDQLRISGNKRDLLQETIQHIKDMGLKLPLQFINFRD